MSLHYTRRGTGEAKRQDSFFTIRTDGHRTGSARVIFFFLTFLYDFHFFSNWSYPFVIQNSLCRVSTERNMNGFEEFGKMCEECVCVCA